MTARTCETCHHGHLKTMTEADPVRTEWRCYRIRTMKDKRGPEKGIVHPGAWGSSCIAERDLLPEPQRVAGDKCGPSGTHWDARK